MKIHFFRRRRRRRRSCCCCCCSSADTTAVSSIAFFVVKNFLFEIKTPQTYRVDIFMTTVRLTLSALQLQQQVIRLQE